jgi:peptidylprolyl isomerase domain and WD repeat-containing protein 1
MSERDAPVLGKRARAEGDNAEREDKVANDEQPAQDDESDDDVGPMPLPLDGAANQAAQKKRKGKPDFWS